MPPVQSVAVAIPCILTVNGINFTAIQRELCVSYVPRANISSAQRRSSPKVFHTLQQSSNLFIYFLYKKKLKRDCVLYVPRANISSAQRRSSPKVFHTLQQSSNLLNFLLKSFFKKRLSSVLTPCRLLS